MGYYDNYISPWGVNLHMHIGADLTSMKGCRTGVLPVSEWPGSSDGVTSLSVSHQPQTEKKSAKEESKEVMLHCVFSVPNWRVCVARSDPRSFSESNNERGGRESGNKATVRTACVGNSLHERVWKLTDVNKIKQAPTASPRNPIAILIESLRIVSGSVAPNICT